MSYSIYDRLGLADAAANGFPAISTELERALGSLDDATAVKVLRCLDPLSVAEEGVSGRAVFGLLGYARYEEFLRAMVGKEGRPGLLLPHHFNEVEFAPITTIFRQPAENDLIGRVTSQTSRHSMGCTRDVTSPTLANHTIFRQPAENDLIGRVTSQTSRHSMGCTRDVTSPTLANQNFSAVWRKSFHWSCDVTDFSAIWLKSFDWSAHPTEIRGRSQSQGPPADPRRPPDRGHGEHLRVRQDVARVDAVCAEGLCPSGCRPHGEALAAIRDSLAASEARAKELAASLARARSEPVALNEKHVPDTTDGNFRDNYDFKRLTYVFPYVLVGTLYGNGVRCANTFTGMIMAVTNVHVTMPSEEVSNIMAKTQLQRAIKERIRVWTGAAPAYSTEMTTRQLYTMCRNFLDYMEDRQAKDIPQATLDGTPLPDTSDPVEVRVWVEQMESVFPDITPLDMGRTVSMDEPLVDRGEHIAGQASLSLYIVRNKIARRRKVRKVASDAEGGRRGGDEQRRRVDWTDSIKRCV
ncbi:hypothetical protein GHT06_003815 [Daphnia sinensis]|uniref:Uncharacterized protein n=1 Tax=Daphnia sinensis TaxID=1820382 RepID=A0AAD5PM10_9CRUS|nr:hypothetical protein GHT06_003815 [Daphnia sinensis]